MRIRNKGLCKIYFNGGVLEPGKIVKFKGGMEKLGAILLAGYPNHLEDLDNVVAEEVVVDDEVDSSEFDEKLEQLKVEAKNLNIKGYALMKADTLKVKIEEAKKGQ